MTGGRPGGSAGERHYLTPAGAKRLSGELSDLLYKTRPRIVEEVAVAAAHGDRSENAEYKYGKRKLREIDSRIRFLQKRLETVVVVDPATQSGDSVFFGATVEIAFESGEQRSYQLVGEDESDPAGGRVSYTSPVGRALLKRRVGDVVMLRRPAGEIEVEILAIRYG